VLIQLRTNQGALITFQQAPSAPLIHIAENIFAVQDFKNIYAAKERTERREQIAELRLILTEQWSAFLWITV
jgi:hypothetical protein